MADVADPAFKTRKEPHLTVDMLRQGWEGLKSGLPSLQGLENWAEERSIPAALEGGLRAATPGEPWEVPLAAVGPLGKTVGKGAAKAAGGAAALLAGTGEAEAATGMRKVFYDLLRANAGDVTKAKGQLKGMASDKAMPRNDRSEASKILKEDIPPALVQRELMTDPNTPNVHDILAGVRRESLLMPDKVFKVGDWRVPVSGDTSLAGVNVKRAGIDLDKPVEMQGGHTFGLSPRAQGNPWASEFGAANTKQKAFERAAEGGGDVLGLHVAMAPQGSHFSKHVPELYREMLRSGPDIDPQHMAAFNLDVAKQLESKRYKKGVEVPSVVRALRDWQGLQSSGLSELLNTNPEMRKALMATADKKGWQNLGFPDMDVLYGAALDPTLKTGDVGGAVMRAAPGKPLTPSEHDTYGFNIPGKRLGRLKVPLPTEMAFPSVHEKFADAPGKVLGSLRTAYWAEPTTQEFIDKASKYTENQLKLLRGRP